MLVCSVSLRPTSRVVAATIVEITEALDGPALGAIYATLADNPGNALDILGAFVGQNMVEAASAIAVVDALSAHPAAMLEAISAAVAAQDAAINVVASLVKRDGMIDGTQVNSDGTARQANVGGTMVNL